MFFSHFPDEDTLKMQLLNGRFRRDDVYLACLENKEEKLDILRLRELFKM